MKASSRFGTVLMGAFAGAFLGAAFAWLASSRAENSDELAIERLGASDYFQLGIGILTLARQFGAMIQKSQEV